MYTGRAVYLWHNAAKVLLHHPRHEVWIGQHLLLCRLLFRLLVQRTSPLHAHVYQGAYFTVQRCKLPAFTAPVRSILRTVSPTLAVK